jgi:hypothetical protein
MYARSTELLFGYPAMLAGVAAVADAGSWILGAGIGVACGWESRARRTARAR